MGTEAVNDRTGHEVDPWEASDEDFTQALLHAGDKGPKPSDLETEGKTTGDAGPGTETETARAAASEGKTTTPTEPEPFRLTRELKEHSQAGAEGDTGEEAGKEDELIPIIHRGQEVRVTRQKLIELGQKGYDYDFKMGPHGRFVKLLEDDPDFAAVTQNYLRAKNEGKPFRFGQPETQTREPATNPFEAAVKAGTAPKLKKLSEYDSEEAWLMDNLKALAPLFRQTEKPTETKPAESAPPRTETATTKREPNPMLTRLSVLDPHYNTVVAKIIPTARERLTVSQMEAIDQDPVEFARFYNWTRKHVLNLGELDGVLPAESAGVENGTGQQDGGRSFVPSKGPARPGFRSKSGGGQLDRTGSEAVADKPWDLKDDEFQQTLDAVKSGAMA